MDVIRDWRPLILKYGDNDDHQTYREFRFACSAPQKTTKHTFHVLKAERGAVNAVFENLRMPQDDTAAVAITWALAQILGQFPSLVPREVRERFEVEVTRFTGEVGHRARKSKRFRRELSKGPRHQPNESWPE